MIRLSWTFLCVPLLAGGCVVSEPSLDRRLEIDNRSDRNVFVRLSYRDPDAGKVERMFRLRCRVEAMPPLSNDSWDSLIRRVGQLTIEFCDERDRDTLQQTVVTETELKSTDWKVVYPKP